VERGTGLTVVFV